jgi:hypothetical protein
MTDEVTLKPCPFCGSKGMIAAALDDMYRPMCERDSCCYLDGHNTRSEAIAAWNARSDQTTFWREECEGLAEALEPFARRKTIEETLASSEPPEWASASPERRIEIIGENKRKHDEDIFNARSALASHAARLIDGVAK